MGVILLLNNVAKSDDCFFSCIFSTFKRNKELKENKERKVVDDQTAIQQENLLLGQDKLPPRSTDK